MCPRAQLALGMVCAVQQQRSKDHPSKAGGMVVGEEEMHGKLGVHKGDHGWVQEAAEDEAMVEDGGRKIIRTTTTTTGGIGIGMGDKLQTQDGEGEEGILQMRIRAIQAKLQTFFRAQEGPLKSTRHMHSMMVVAADLGRRRRRS